MICKFCQNDIEDTSRSCPHCEKNFFDDSAEPAADSTAEEKTLEAVSSPPKKRRLRIIACILAVILLALATAWILKANTMTKKDQAAYEMLLEIVGDFKNPDSVRLLGGSVFPEENSMWCQISAKNGFGTESSESYFIWDGDIYEESNSYYIQNFCKKTDELNISLINKKLKKTIQGRNYNVSSPSAGNSGSSWNDNSAEGRARSYLRSSAFSYEGLVEQLEYEGFSHYEAVNAVDNCGADWNEQAEKKAKSYLRTSAFSRKGLIEQLEYEGFTSSQATYGVNHCGADWKEQAVKKAQQYKRLFSFSRSEMIEQLEYEGFTYSEAAYGASQCGN